MGYCIEQRDARFNIRPSNLAPALAAIKALDNGSGRYFDWVDTQEFMQAETLLEAMRAWRWDLKVEPISGEILNLQFLGEKLGDDVILFRAIAPFVEPGSYIEMQGEDGALWRWVFDGTQCKEHTATVSVSWD